MAKKRPGGWKGKPKRAAATIVKNGKRVPAATKGKASKKTKKPKPAVRIGKDADHSFSLGRCIALRDNYRRHEQTRKDHEQKAKEAAEKLALPNLSQADKKTLALALYQSKKGAGYCNTTMRKIVTDIFNVLDAAEHGTLYDAAQPGADDLALVNPPEVSTAGSDTTPTLPYGKESAGSWHLETFHKHIQGGAFVLKDVTPDDIEAAIKSLGEANTPFAVLEILNSWAADTSDGILGGFPDTPRWFVAQALDFIASRSRGQPGDATTKVNGFLQSIYNSGKVGRDGLKKLSTSAWKLAREVVQAADKAHVDDAAREAEADAGEKPDDEA